MADEIKKAYSDAKLFGQRVTKHGQTTEDMVKQFTQIYQQIEADRRTNCDVFRQQLILYTENKDTHPRLYQEILNDFKGKLNNLDDAYKKCLAHMAQVSCAGFMALPQKAKAHAAQVTSKQNNMDFGKEAVVRAACELEWQRIETDKLALMHFANACMYLHAQALEIYSATYAKLEKLDF